MNAFSGKTVVFCLPGREFSHNFLQSWSELLLWVLSNNIRPLLINHYSSNVYYVRNSCLGGDVTRGIKQKPYDGKVKYDYMMWIDSDVVFSPQQFVELLKVDKPIVSGLYMMQDNTHFATVENMNDEFFKTHGSYKFLTRDDLRKKKEPFKVDYTGFGWMLIKYGIFEQLDYPWFRPLWTTINKGSVTMNDFCSEDVGFCQLVREKGNDIWVTPNAVVGHEKMMIL